MNKSQRFGTSQRVDCILAVCLLLLPASLRAQRTAIENPTNQISVNPDGSYAIRAKGMAPPVVIGRVAAQIDHHWIASSDYPKHTASESAFDGSLGRGRALTLTFSGLRGQPDLSCVLRLYGNKPYGEIEAQVVNTTSKGVTVQTIRPMETVGTPPVSLGGSEAADRILSDSYSEDRPVMRIYDLGKAPGGVHRGVGSQLIYNRQSGASLFLGALASEKFLTVLRLAVARAGPAAPRIVSYTVDSTGTTEIQKDYALRNAPPQDRMELSLPVPPGKSLASEPLMFAAGRGYHAQLEAYGRAIRVLHHARVDGPHPMGWWSWTAFYGGINEGEVETNAQWLAAHLKSLGYRFFHIDEGYQYARGEYTTPNATQFPHGMRFLGRRITRRGLKLGLWTAPFEVSSRAWVYERHKDWLVHNAAGQPIQIGFVQPGQDALYVLDTTHPGAQAYLRQTYRTLTREWNVRYIKLDFMDDTAIEGVHYRANTTALEAQRIGLKIIRQAVGNGVLLDKDGSPMLNPVGILDEGRISVDTGHSFKASKDAATGIAARYYMDGNFFVSDPDAFSVSRQLLPEEHWHQSKTGLTRNHAQVAIVLAALAGGMFEIGDDLPTLGAEPNRLALVENPDLLNLSRLGRAAVPLDLMTYRERDEQPSIFLLREDARQTLLAVFNWTGQPRTHTFTPASLHLPDRCACIAFNVLSGARRTAFINGKLRIAQQPPQSVRLFRIVNVAMRPAAPLVAPVVPKAAQIGEAAKFAACVSPSGVPALGIHWDFGDGTGAHGAVVRHTYTRAGSFTVRLKVDGMDGIPAQAMFPLEATGTLHSAMDLPANRRYTGPAAPLEQPVTPCAGPQTVAH
jgi:alpha-galactosidase